MLKMISLDELNKMWMASPTNQALRKQMYDKVLQSAKDLIRKGYIPEKHHGQVMQNIDGAVNEMIQSPFKECSCTKCGITFYGPKKWLHFHNGLCLRVDKKEGMDGEIMGQSYKLY